MTDIVERIRNLRYVHVPVASQLMAEAAAEIERLRLTDEERAAISDAIKTVSEALDLMDGEDSLTTATLRNLLERLTVK
jgi:malonyl CoA-acyl carrier protein transacylase